MAFGLLPIYLARRLKGSFPQDREDSRTFMNEFLLLALVIIYLVISYVPISGAPKPTWLIQRDERSSSSDGNAETDATSAHKSPFGS